MSDPADNQRLIGDVVRFGTVAEIDLASATCRVQVGEILTGDLPWLAARAGTTAFWSPPIPGEQCVLLCAEGDMLAGIVLLGLYSDAHPAPSSTARQLIRFADGAELAYDPEAHALEAILPGVSTARIVASGGITLVGPVRIEGAVEVTETIKARGDVTAAGISLQKHKHGQVQSGGSVSGLPL